MVGDINLVVPNLIAIFIAKMVAEQFSKPLYKYHLDAKVLPYLEQEPKVIVAGKLYV
jgi:H+/Cl- antiporter ClcA